MTRPMKRWRVLPTFLNFLVWNYIKIPVHSSPLTDHELIPHLSSFSRDESGRQEIRPPPVVDFRHPAGQRDNGGDPSLVQSQVDLDLVEPRNHHGDGNIINKNNRAFRESMGVKPEGVSSLRTPTTSSSSSSSSCTSHSNCTECQQAWGCHWCTHDQACHVMGSAYGCAWGVTTCPEAKPDHNNNYDNSTNNTDHLWGCSAHLTCASCAQASHFCHWCAHDRACHAIGSIYGCVSGVDCYSNERCRRPEPQPLSRTQIDQDFVSIRTLYKVLVLLIMSLALALTMLCMCVSCGIKGAYDDLADLTAPGPVLAALDLPLRSEEEPLLSAAEAAGEPASHPPSPSATTSLVVPSTADHEAQDEGMTTMNGGPNETGPSDSEIDAAGALQPPDDVVDSSMADEARATVTLYRTERPLRRRQRHQNMRRLYQACVGCSLVTMMAWAALMAATVLYYPKIPQYNICNDAVAWKSIMDGLASMKVSADFEILASLANPNIFDVALEMGKGTMMHEGVFIGTFDVPPFVAKGRSITDAMVVANLTPDKWEALSLTAEYYRGKLVLSADVQATFRIPALWNYSVSIQRKAVLVHVNETADRHLCTCPTWNDHPGNRTISI